MTGPIETSILQRLVLKLDPQGKLLKAWELQGGVSASVTAIEYQIADGSTRKMVVRVHGEANRRGNPDIASDEFNLLGILHSADIPAPNPLYLDLSCGLFPHPAIVLTYIEGETNFDPTDQDSTVCVMAENLAAIHRIQPATTDLSFLPHKTIHLLDASENPDESLFEGRIREVLRSVIPISTLNPPVLLHGDYWSGNILWHDGELAGVLDWEDAALGDPLADLANSRLEVLWAYGVKAMQRFTDHYRSQSSINIANLPYWDLYAALETIHKIGTWGLDPKAEEKMRARQHWFTSRALEGITA